MVKPSTETYDLTKMTRGQLGRQILNMVGKGSLGSFAGFSMVFSTAFFASMLFPAIVFVVPELIGYSIYFGGSLAGLLKGLSEASKDVANNQAEIALGIIKIGAESNVERLKITLSNKAALSLKEQLDKLPISFTIDLGINTVIDVKYKD